MLSNCVTNWITWWLLFFDTQLQRHSLNLASKCHPLLNVTVSNKAQIAGKYYGVKLVNYALRIQK